MSANSSLPNLFIIKLCSIDATTGLIADGLSNPAASQSVTTASPNWLCNLIWLVIAMIMKSGRSLLYRAELMITAGRFLLLL